MNDGSVLVRPVREEDASGLRALADLLDTVNLPDDPVAIAGLIRDSQHSFALLEPGANPAAKDPKHASFTFVVVRRDGGEERVLGTASLFAYHGMPDDPHYYLRLVEQTVHRK